MIVRFSAVFSLGAAGLFGAVAGVAQLLLWLRL